MFWFSLFYFSVSLWNYLSKIQQEYRVFSQSILLYEREDREIVALNMSDGKSVGMCIQDYIKVQTNAVMEARRLKWYALCTIPGCEQEAAELLEKKVSRKLWGQCRILKKQQLFRTQGRYLMSRKELFPGYIFVSTESPGELSEELIRAKRFPQLVGSYKADIVPIEPRDLQFLENVCGKGLEHDMQLSTVWVDEEGQVQSAVGALKPYVGRIKRQRLRHRYVTAEVPLFSRRAEVLFGIRMEGDPR